MTEKDLSPLVFKRERGTDKRALSVDFKSLVDGKGIIRSDGASLLRALITNNRILN